MQVSVETTEGLGRRMKVQVPGDRVDSQVRERLRNLATRAKIKGFRPGKIPPRVVERRFGGRVRQEVVDEVMRKSFYEAVMQEQLRLAGDPTIEQIDMEPGKDLEYTASFEVYPDVTLAAVEEVKVSRPVVEIAEQDIDAMIETLRRQHTRWSPVERGAEVGDQVIVSYTGTVDGKPINDSQPRQVPVIMGAGDVVRELDQALVGTTAGAELSLDLTFPPDHRLKDVAGKACHLDVKVISVAVGELPDVDEGFARELGVTEGGVEAFRAEVLANMQRELRQAVRSRIKQQVMDGLLAGHSLELPHAMVTKEMERMAEQARAHLSFAHRPEQALGAARFELPARRRVALGLILAEIVGRNGLRASPEKVRGMIDEVASSYEHPAELVNWYYADKSRLAEVESAVLEDEVVDWVLGRAEVSEEVQSFGEIMKPEQPASLDEVLADTAGQA